MAIKRIDTLVVGAGQAGVAMSEHLSNLGVPHLVLERAHIAERWRTETLGFRWLPTVLPGTTVSRTWSSRISTPTLLLIKIELLNI